MKELIENLKLSLSNLSEKLSDEYVDDFIDIDIDEEKEIPASFKEIAIEAQRMVDNYQFEDSESDDAHPFLEMDKSFSEKLGFDSIYIIPYKGQAHSDYLVSNYIYNIIDDSKVFEIDIYDCFYNNDDNEYVFNQTLTELFNFRRDATWVKEDIYEEEMKKMKELKEIMRNSFGL